MTELVRELDAQTYEAVKSYCEQGERLVDDERYEDAISEYNKAWKLIPSPKNEWNASTWILAAIGDAAFLGGYNTSAREALQYAMTCPGAIGNAFLHLRLGEVLLNEGNADAAADELMRAYMGGGAEIFENEDPKYLKFLKSRANI